MQVAFDIVVGIIVLAMVLRFVAACISRI